MVRCSGGRPEGSAFGLGIAPWPRTGGRQGVTVFGGSAAVLLSAAPYPIETGNDSNTGGVNFFRRGRTGGGPDAVGRHRHRVRHLRGGVGIRCGGKPSRVLPQVGRRVLKCRPWPWWHSHVRGAETRGASTQERLLTVPPRLSRLGYQARPGRGAA